MLETSAEYGGHAHPSPVEAKGATPVQIGPLLLPKFVPRLPLPDGAVLVASTESQEDYWMPDGSRTYVKPSGNVHSSMRWYILALRVDEMGLPKAETDLAIGEQFWPDFRLDSAARKQYPDCGRPNLWRKHSLCAAAIGMDNIRRWESKGSCGWVCIPMNVVVPLPKVESIGKDKEPDAHLGQHLAVIEAEVEKVSAPILGISGAEDCLVMCEHAIENARELDRLEVLVAELRDTQQHTQDWYGQRWKAISEWMRSPEMRGTQASQKWFNILANGVEESSPPMTFMARVNMDRYQLAKLERLGSELGVVASEVQESFSKGRKVSKALKEKLGAVLHAWNRRGK